MAEAQDTLKKSDEREKQSKAELDSLQEKLEAALLAGAQTRDALAALVLNEVKATRAADADQVKGRNVPVPVDKDKAVDAKGKESKAQMEVAQPKVVYSESAQAEIDAQRIKASTIKLEAEKERANAEKREEMLQAKIKLAQDEKEQLKRQVEQWKTEAANSQREAAEAKQAAAVARSEAAVMKSKAEVATAEMAKRETEVKALLAKSKTDGEVNVAEKIAAVKQEAMDQILEARKQAAEREERAALMETKAAELQSQLARKEAELEEGFTLAVRAETAVKAAEGRAMAAEHRYALERKETTKIQLDWALQQEKEVQERAQAEVDKVLGENDKLRRELLKANSETSAWRKKAGDFEADLASAATTKEQAVNAAAKAEALADEATAALSGVEDRALIAEDEAKRGEVHTATVVAEVKRAEMSVDQALMVIDELTKLKAAAEGTTPEAASRAIKEAMRQRMEEKAAEQEAAERLAAEKAAERESKQKLRDREKRGAQEKRLEEARAAREAKKGGGAAKQSPPVKSGNKGKEGSGGKKGKSPQSSSREYPSASLASATGGLASASHSPAGSARSGGSNGSPSKAKRGKPAKK